MSYFHEDANRQRLEMHYAEGAVVIDYLRAQIARMEADRKMFEARIADLDAKGSALRQQLRNSDPATTRKPEETTDGQ